MSTNIDGTVTAISHVFYLSGTSKSFWIQVLMKNEDKPRNILIPVEKTVNGTFKNVQIYPEKYLGKQFTVKNVKRSNLSMNSGYVKIYRTNEYSTIDQVPTSIVSEPPANYNSKSKPKKSGGLINIEGIVTNDKFVQAGIFILDNKITVVISSLCVITNIKEVQSGHKVSIRNGHILKMANEKTAVILCAKSLLIIHKQQVDPDMDGDGLLNLTGKFSIHNSKSERERFESNVFIQDCLHLRLSPKQSLKLFEYLTILEKNIKEMKNSDLKQNLFLDYASSNHANKNNNLEHLIDFFNVEIKKVPHRSLLNEFLSYPHQCSVDVPDDSDKWPNINNLKTTMNTIEEYLKSQDNIDSNEKTNTPCRYKYQILKSNEVEEVPKIFGYLTIDHETGQYILKDNSYQVDVIVVADISMDDFSRQINNVVILIQWVAVIEFISVGKFEWTHRYLIIKELKSLSRSSDDTETFQKPNTEHIFWSVRFASHPMILNGSSNQEICVIVGAKNLKNSEQKFLRIPIKLGKIKFPIKCELLLKNVNCIEKYSHQLKNMIQSGLISSSVTPHIIDVLDFEVSDDGQFDVNDVYDVDDLDKIPVNHLINVEGSIVSKWIELSKNATGQTNDDPLLSHVDLELKLTNCAGNGGKVISLYITKWDKKTNPIGLIRGAKVRFYQIQKMVSKKSNAYLVTTLLSTYDILDINPYLDPTSHQRLYEQPVNFLFELPENNSEAFHCCFTVDKIFKITIMAKCGSCGNEIRNGLCSFVGCHIGTSVQIKYLTRGNFKVYDICESANLICDDAQIIQKIMKWSLGNWKMLTEEAVKRGELLFLNNGGKNDKMINNETSSTVRWFYEQCLVIPETELRQFRCICRAFKKQDTNNSATKTLYCIDVYSEKED